MDQRSIRLLKSLEKRRDHGIRKTYNGRKSTTRYDSIAATLIEIHNRPIRLWVDDVAQESRAGGRDERSLSLAFKPSSDKDRKNVDFDVPYSFIDDKDKEYVVHFHRVDLPKPKSGLARRVICTVEERVEGGKLRACSIASLKQ